MLSIPIDEKYLVSFIRTYLDKTKFEHEFVLFVNQGNLIIMSLYKYKQILLKHKEDMAVNVMINNLDNKNKELTDRCIELENKLTKVQQEKKAFIDEMTEKCASLQKQLDALAPLIEEIPKLQKKHELQCNFDRLYYKAVELVDAQHPEINLKAEISNKYKELSAND